MPFFTSALLLRRDFDLERDLCFLLDLFSLLRERRLRDLLRLCRLDRDLDLEQERLGSNICKINVTEDGSKHKIAF